ncbi:MAG: DUF362 domain-containing protein [Lentisphaerae bacterium]|nr:DUF362 domain-containing protein [Lentisphaerota bacterium]
MKRRTFLKGMGIAAAGTLMPRRLWAEGRTAEVVVTHGGDAAAMLAAGIARFGGWTALVQAGRKATIKPNAAWASRPEQGGNTSPDVVRACVRACRQAGASEVVLPEHPCSAPDRSFTMSGIREAAEDAGGRLYSPTNADYRRVTLPDAVTLKEAEVVTDVLETGCLIDLPVAKNHSGATLTLAMKNWMGSVKDRGFWHRAGLHQCIADFTTFVKPTLVIIDATRIMLKGGPRGPGELAYPGELIFSRDPVAADAYAATLFDKDPMEIPYLEKAHAMGAGCADLNRITVTRVACG